MAKKARGKKKKKVVSKKRLVTNTRLRRYLAIIVVLTGFIVYANTLTHGYALDDSSAVVDNYVTKQGFKGIPTILTKHYRYGFWNNPPQLYRPISQVMLAIEWQIAPDTPGLYHLVNVLLLAATGFLIFFLLSELLNRRNILIPFLSAVLFMVHPIHVEVVANIKSRDEILAFFFGLLAILYLVRYVRKNEKKHLLMALAAYTLGMFSKENLITFLAVFPLVLFFFTKADTKKIFQISALFLIPAGLYLFIRSNIVGSTIGGHEAISVLDNVLAGEGSWISKLPTAFLLLGKYLKNLLLPHPLAHDFGFNAIPRTSWSDWRVLLSLLVHLGLTGWAVLNLKKRKLASFAILFYIITFSIYTNLLIPIGSSYGDRFMYISSLAYCIGLSWVLVKFLGDRTHKKYSDLSDFINKNKSVLLVASVLVLAYGMKTILRNPAWKDSLTLYATDSKIAPKSAKVRYHHGLELAKKGAASNDQTEKIRYIDESIVELNAALAVYPKYHDAFSELGLNYFRRGDPQKALENYEKALEINPKSHQVYSNMGIIYFNQQNLGKAREVYEKAVSLNPRFVDARRNLGAVFAIQKQHEKAAEQFREGLKYAPNSAILHFYLGNALRDGGNPQAAQPHYDRAYQLDPSLRK